MQNVQNSLGFIGLTVVDCYNRLAIDHPLNLKCCITSKLSRATLHDSNKTASDKLAGLKEEYANIGFTWLMLILLKAGDVKRHCHCASLIDCST